MKLGKGHVQERSFDDTVAGKVTAAGFDPETFDDIALLGESVAPAAFQGEDGTLIVGLVFKTDYDATQEYGIGDVREAVTGKDPRNFRMTKAGSDHASVFTDVNGFALSSRGRSTTAITWGEPVVADPWGGDAGYVEQWKRSLPYTQGNGAAQSIRYRKMDELRAIARKVGLSPIPRRKDDVVAALQANETFQDLYGKPERPNTWPAPFQGGATLVVRADTGPAAVIVDALKDAILAGTFGIGSYSGPFRTGVFLYDTADETQAIVDAREARFDWHDARMAELEPVKALLKEEGHSFYSLGRPTELESRHGGGGPGVYYWLNGSSGYTTKGGVRVTKQPFGWYTLDELLDEAFLNEGNSSPVQDAR